VFLNVLLLGIASGIDPSKIAAVTYIMSKAARPVRLLVAYLVGAFGVSLIVGAFILFVLGNTGLSKSSGPPAALLTAIGILSLVVAVLVATGLTERIRDWGNKRRRGTAGAANLINRSANAESAVGGSGPQDKIDKMEESIQKVPGLRKLLPPIRRALASESPWIAWAAGVGVGIPNAYYLAAIAIVLKSHVSALPQVLYLILFNLFNFGAVIVQLVAYLRAPQATASFVAGTNAWVSAHHRAFVAALAGVVGAYLVILGVTRMG
jgi:Sap-like sulfolipid-1-addressing protein